MEKRNDACVSGLDCSALGEVLALAVESETKDDFEACWSRGGNAQLDMVRRTVWLCMFVLAMHFGFAAAGARNDVKVLHQLFFQSQTVMVFENNISMSQTAVPGRWTITCFTVSTDQAEQKTILELVLTLDNAMQRRQLLGAYIACWQSRRMFLVLGRNRSNIGRTR